MQPPARKGQSQGAVANAQVARRFALAGSRLSKLIRVVGGSVAFQKTLPLSKTRDDGSFHQCSGEFDESFVCRKLDGPVKHRLSSNVCVARD